MTVPTMRKTKTQQAPICNPRASAESRLHRGRRVISGSILWSLLFTLFLLDACSNPFATNDDRIVSSLRFVPSAFDSFRQNAEIRYTLKTTEEVSIFITHRDSVGRQYTIATLVQSSLETAGSHGHTWLGNTDKGYFAPVGLYLGVLSIRDHQFETAVLLYHNSYLHPLSSARSNHPLLLTEERG
jgi:hypothetical protein